MECWRGELAPKTYHAGVFGKLARLNCRLSSIGGGIPEGKFTWIFVKAERLVCIRNFSLYSICLGVICDLKLLKRGASHHVCAA